MAFSVYVCNPTYVGDSLVSVQKVQIVPPRTEPTSCWIGQKGKTQTRFESFWQYGYMGLIWIYMEIYVYRRPDLLGNNISVLGKNLFDNIKILTTRPVAWMGKFMLIFNVNQRDRFVTGKICTSYTDTGENLQKKAITAKKIIFYLLRKHPTPLHYKALQQQKTES